MTITRKPQRSTKAKPGQELGATAETFIKAAQHGAEEPVAPEAAPVLSASSGVAAAPAEPEAAQAAHPLPPSEKKGGRKDKKGKDKKKKGKKKEAVLIRFDDGQLTRIDGVALALGLSRAAWVRMVVARALAD